MTQKRARGQDLRDVIARFIRIQVRNPPEPNAATQDYEIQTPYDTLVSYLCMLSSHNNQLLQSMCMLSRVGFDKSMIYKVIWVLDIGLQLSSN